MKQLFVICLFALSIVNAEIAVAKEPILVLRQLCIADHGTGFNWENGAWTQVNYIEPKYAVLKVDYPNDISDDSSGDEFEKYLHCTLEIGKRTGVNLDAYKSYNACLKVQKVGEDYSTYLACREIHVKSNETGKWRVKFDCSDNKYNSFHMRPNGRFHKGYIHANVQDEPEDDYKDSLTIYVGKCVDIAG